jgi:hypothetical protein
MVVSVWGVMMITGLGEPVGHTRPSVVLDDGGAPHRGESSTAGEVQQ